MFRYLTYLLLTFGLPSQILANPQDLSMFPKAANTQSRYVIRLPAKTNEQDFKIELLAGQQRMVDCNLHFLQGKLITHTINGWGYPYYEVQSSGSLGSTKKACIDQAKRMQFVLAAKQLLRYNSRLPVVIYVPKGFEVHYRIWSTTATQQPAAQG